MENLETTLKAWRCTVPQQLACETITTDPAFQPRASRLLHVQDRVRYEDLSGEHVSRLRLTLDAGASIELEPVLVAHVDGVPVLVDGHHRLLAYRRAGRRMVPARVVPLSRKQAVLASKLVNLGSVTLPMHAAQLREAAWQYLAHLTARGTKPLPVGVSLRSVAAKFSTSVDTVSRMARKLASVRREDYANDALDSGTGWPCWRFVCESVWKGGLDAMSPEQQQQWQAEKLAKRIAKLRDSTNPVTFRSAVRLLIAESTDEEVREDWNEMAQLIGDDVTDF